LQIETIPTIILFANTDLVDLDDFFLQIMNRLLDYGPLQPGVHPIISSTDHLQAGQIEIGDISNHICDPEILLNHILHSLKTN
jgi:hypothetical protein